MNTKKVVLLDLMSTLMLDPFYETVNKLSGNIEEFMKFKNPAAYIQFESGKITEDEYMKNIFLKDKENLAPFTAEQFRESMLGKSELLPGVIPLLKEIRPSCSIYIASNYGPWIENHFHNSGLDQMTDGYFVSHRLKVRKPDVQFFKKIIQQLKISPSEIFFVDDQKQNVASASTLGIDSLLAENGWMKILKQKLI